MSTVDLVIRAVHVVSASIWLGAAFFAGWFLMPAVQEIGPEGGKVMAAIQRRGWVALLPIIATLTVLSGFWLYRPYMGAPGHASMVLGSGGVIGVIALALAAGVVSLSIAKANGLMTKAAAMPEGAGRASAMASVRQLRQRALTFARIVSLLVILAAVLMTIAAFV